MKRLGKMGRLERMKKLGEMLVAGVMALGVLVVPVVSGALVWAAPATPEAATYEGGGSSAGGSSSGGSSSGGSSTSGGPTGTTGETNIIHANSIEDLLNILLNVLVYGLGGAAVLGVVISGVLYMTARDNEQQVAAAKKRLFEVVIGLVAWALMYTVLQWLVPGSLGF